MNDKSNGVIIYLVSSEKVIGVIAGKRVKQTVNMEEFTAIEVVFYLNEGSRNILHQKLLYGAFKHWAKLVGCKTIMMGRIREPGKQEEYYMKRLK